MRLLDLYCGAGGAGRGYHRAGFDVTGIDLLEQKHYPHTFIRGDVLNLDPHWIASEFDAVHASPPCQAHTGLKHAPGGKLHADLIPATRQLLKRTGLPYVIENVVGAPLIAPITLCGSMFGLAAGEYQLRRHRLFEINWNIPKVPECRHTTPVIGVYGGHVRCRSSAHGGRLSRDFPDADKKKLAQVAMGIDWMTMNEMSQAIPPMYTDWIGRRMLKHMEGSSGNG